MSGKIHNYIFILSKSSNKYVELFNEYITNSHIIYDSDIPDQPLREGNYCCLTETIKQISAWDKTFYTLINDQEYFLNKYDYFYFIEDDVYCKKIEVFHQLFSILDNYPHDLVAHDIYTKQNFPKWMWWKKYPEYTVRSYNPICRLSNRLIRLIVNYFKENKKLLFHEILFASLAYEYKLETLNFNLVDEYKNLFGTFRYRPIINIKNIKDNKIYHPVKPLYERI